MRGGRGRDDNPMREKRQRGTGNNNMPGLLLPLERFGIRSVLIVSTLLNSPGPHDHAGELRLLIPSRAAGAIIGKGGEYIKRLRSEFNCSVHVPGLSKFKCIY